jgi:hypothetical protein
VERGESRRRRGARGGAVRRRGRRDDEPSAASDRPRSGSSPRGCPRLAGRASRLGRGARDPLSPLCS